MTRYVRGRPPAGRGGPVRLTVTARLEDGVLAQRVEEVRSVHEPAQPLGDDPEERRERVETRPAGHEGPEAVVAISQFSVTRLAGAQPRPRSRRR